MHSEGRALAVRIARGEDPVRRIVTMRHFTYEVDGEEVLFTEELQDEVQRLGGGELVEQTPKEYPGDRVLRYKDQGTALAALALEG